MKPPIVVEPDHRHDGIAVEKFESDGVACITSPNTLAALGHLAVAVRMAGS
jgi:hypothetical protein